MLVLLWAIINFGMFVVFLGLCSKATSFIREKFGLVASIIFVIALLSFAGKSGKDDSNGTQSSKYHKTWQHAPQQSPEIGPTFHAEINLEETSIANYELGILYRKENGRVVPVSSYSSTSGFSFGTYWKPGALSVAASPDNTKLFYSVSGTVEWKLFGLGTYYQQKVYNGEFQAE